MTNTPSDRERKEEEERLARLQAECKFLEKLCDLAEEDRGTLQYKEFNLKATLYQSVDNMIVAMGHEEALRCLVDAEDDEDMEISMEDRRQMNEDYEDLVAAIEQGMSLREFLDSYSARSWLDGEQSNGGA